MFHVKHVSTLDLTHVIAHINYVTVHILPHCSYTAPKLQHCAYIAPKLGHYVYVWPKLRNCAYTGPKLRHCAYVCRKSSVISQCAYYYPPVVILMAPIHLIPTYIPPTNALIQSSCVYNFPLLIFGKTSVH